MDSALLSPITQDIIAFMADGSKNSTALGEEVRAAASSDPTGQTIRSNFQFAMILSDEEKNIPIFYRLIVAKALILHVDWEEVAAFFSNNNNTETEEV